MSDDIYKLCSVERRRTQKLLAKNVNFHFMLLSGGYIFVIIIRSDDISKLSSVERCCTHFCNL